MTPLAPSAVTPVAFLRSIADAYLDAGLDFARTLDTSGIPASIMDRPDGRVTAVQFEALSYTAMQELNDEALGWFSRRLPWGTYGMLARASLSAPTLRVAIKRWCRHHSLLTQDVCLRLNEVQGELACIELDEDPGWHPTQDYTREFCHVSMLRNLLGLSSWLIDSRIALLSADFAFPPPSHVDAYRHLFPCTVSFSAQRTRVVLNNSYLSLSLRRDEHSMQRMLARALPLTIHTYRRDRLLVERVMQALALQLTQMRTAENVASALNVSTRTLQRQLSDAGTTFFQLKSKVQIQQAKELLLRTNRPIKQVALAVGYKNDKSFIRAFGAAIGQTPDQFRQGL